MKFPTKPHSVDPSVTRPSKEFVRETYKVSISIIGFIIIYFILFTLGLALAIGAGYLGYLIVINKPGIVTLMIGIALCIFGVFIVYFLIKFITTKNTYNTSHLHEVKLSDEPQLFKFVEQVVEEVGSDLPKNIFLSNEVNAYVFYNSNFWSLFFPVKKNLTIGLGLINSINLSEFKAILAHEFGHFSQKSMKLGSYIYYVNKVIHDMLYDNESFEQTITKLSEANGYLAIAGTLTFLVIRLIQFILRLIYKPINIMYLSLSRQMEFNADAVAASVAGGNHLVSSLRRLEISDLCFNTVMSQYNEWGFTKFRSDNIYSNHKEAQKHYAKDHDLKFTHDNVETNEMPVLIETNTNRIEIKDQWASHPTLRQRADFLNSLNLTTQSIDDSPWTLFSDPIKLQKRFTNYLFTNLSEGKPTQSLDNEEFSKKYYESFDKFSYPKEYFGFFDHYFPDNIELEETGDAAKNHKLGDILSKKEIKKLLDSSNIYNDLNMLQIIIDGNSGIKSFDFDGQKYKSKKAKEVYAIIEKEADAITKQYENTTKKIIQYFYSLAIKQEKGDEFKSKYQNLKSELEEYQTDYQIYNAIQTTISPIFQGEVKFKIAEQLSNNVNNLEIEFKKIINKKIELNHLKQEDFNEYLERERKYFAVDSFNEKNIEILLLALDMFIEEQNTRLTKLKKEFLEYQINLNNR